jgi:hypothetical protein
MGTVVSVGVCYKSKPHVVTKEDILKALNEKILRETIKPTIPLLSSDATKENYSGSGLGRMISQEATKATT